MIEAANDITLWRLLLWQTNLKPTALEKVQSLQLCSYALDAAADTAVSSMPTFLL